MPYWVTGFCDRSGSFGLTMNRHTNGKWRFKITFEVVVGLANIHLIEKLQTFFGVGKIYTNTTNATYRVVSIKELLVIIAHFTVFPLISPKLVIYNLWAEVVHLIHAGQHLNPET